MVGWNSYDAKTAWLPPEHFAAHALREALAHSCHQGPLKGQGPDGKLLLVMSEDARGWRLETLLITLQQLEATRFLQLTQADQYQAALLAIAFGNAAPKDVLEVASPAEGMTLQ